MAENNEETPPSTPEPTEEPKKEKKPKKSAKEFETQMKDQFGKWGYTTIFDYLTFIIGLYGLGWFFWEMITSLLNPFGNPAGNTLYWIISFLVNLMITLFPFFAKFVVKLHEKWSWIPLSFIKTEENSRKLVLYLGWWSTLLFWWVRTFFGLYAFWWYGLMFIVLTIVNFKDLFKKG